MLSRSYRSRLILIFATLPYIILFQNCSRSGFVTDFQEQNIASKKALTPLPLSMDCEFQGNLLKDGDQIEAFQNSAVSFGDRCVSQKRTCNKGILSGTFNFLNCSVGVHRSCLFDGKTVPHGKKVAAFLSSSVEFNDSCKGEGRECFNGVLSGQYQYPTCNKAAPKDCLFNGRAYIHATSIETFANSSVSAAKGEVCKKETRVCNNGSFTGSFNFPNCEVLAQKSCIFNGRTLAHGEQTAAFQYSSVPFGQECVVGEFRKCTDGVLSGSYANPTCSVGAPKTCFFNGVAVAHGATVNAYMNSSVPAKGSCSLELRTCNNGNLSGSYSFVSCAKEAPSSCMFDGRMIAHSEKITAFQNSSVAFGRECVSEERECSDGVLKGNYAFATCSVGTGKSCLFNGSSIAHGATVNAYMNSSVPANSSCSIEVRTCNNGSLSGSYNFANCDREALKSCLFNGRLLASGEQVRAFLESSVKFSSGRECQFQTRSCNNGILNGSYQYSNCSKDAPKSCLFAGRTIAHGESVESFLNSSVPFGGVCQKESRLCFDGVLQGSFSYANCAKQAPRSCLFDGRTVAHGEKIKVFEASSVPFGQTCVAVDRLCTDGSLSGASSFPNCAVGEPKACAVDGVVVPHQATIKLYSKTNSAFSSSEKCKDLIATRQCVNGILTGQENFRFIKCSDDQARACVLDGRTISHDEIVVAYQTANSDEYGFCEKQDRKCNDGQMDGSFNFMSCSLRSAPPKFLGTDWETRPSLFDSSSDGKLRLSKPLYDYQFLPSRQVNPIILVRVLKSDIPSSIQWKKNGVNVTLEANKRATEYNYTNYTAEIPYNLQTTAGEYQAVITNQYGSVASQPQKVFVIAPPQIVSQSSSAVVKAGEPFSIKIQALSPSGDALTYNWKKDGKDFGSSWSQISNSKSSLLDAGVYTVTVSNIWGSVQSLPIKIEVISQGEEEKPTYDAVITVSTDGPLYDFYNNQHLPTHYAGDPNKILMRWIYPNGTETQRLGPYGFYTPFRPKNESDYGDMKLIIYDENGVIIKQKIFKMEDKIKLVSSPSSLTVKEGDDVNLDVSVQSYTSGPMELSILKGGTSIRTDRVLYTTGKLNHRFTLKNISRKISGDYSIRYGKLGLTSDDSAAFKITVTDGIRKPLEALDFSAMIPKENRRRASTRMMVNGYELFSLPYTYIYSMLKPLEYPLTVESNGNKLDSEITLPTIQKPANLMPDQHDCALDNKILKCWGSNSNGQLGNGSTTASLVPVTVSFQKANPNIQAYSVGYYHTCALVDGSFQCWGGRLAQTTKPRVVISSGVVAIFGNCAMTDKGAFICWMGVDSDTIDYTSKIRSVFDYEPGEVSMVSTQGGPVIMDVTHLGVVYKFRLNGNDLEYTTSTNSKVISTGEGSAYSLFYSASTDEGFKIFYTAFGRDNRGAYRYADLKYILIDNNHNINIKHVGRTGRDVGYQILRFGQDFYMSGGNISPVAGKVGGDLRTAWGFWGF